MKQAVVRGVFFCLVVLSGISLFVLKNKVIEEEKVLKQIHKRIFTDSREIQILKSEWANLNDPENLRRLIKAVHLNLVPITLPKVVEVEKLPIKQIPVPEEKPKDML